MSKFANAEKVGLRDKETNKIVEVYPEKATGSDEEITKTVKDWYYSRSCGAEDRLLSLYVDVLTESEIKERQ